jgi:hypothetical protein
VNGGLLDLDAALSGNGYKRLGKNTPTFIGYLNNANAGDVCLRMTMNAVYSS